MKDTFLIVCLAFGLLMITSFAQAQEIEGVYCRVDVKQWNGSLIDFLKQGTKCKVKVKAEWQGNEYSQTISIDPDKINLAGIWSKLNND